MTGSQSIRRVWIQLTTLIVLAVASTALGQTDECGAIDLALAAMKKDSLFQSPYVDLDEWRDKPVRHRYIHGGFKDTETRFSIYLPPAEKYQGRFFQYITPVPMNENLSQGATGEEDKIGFSIGSGAYFVETNGGGMAAMMKDSTVAAYRANAAVAQYSRVIAMRMYGCGGPYGYAFGGSGGGYRTIGGMENTKGVWDGAVPYGIGSPMAMPNVFTVRMYALRILQGKLAAIADAVDVGSKTAVEDILTDSEYEAFQEVSKMGFPRQAWYVADKLDLHGFAALLPGVVAADPEYFRNDFWKLPGYEGHDSPKSLVDALIEDSTKVKTVVFSANAEATGLKQAIYDTVPKGLADDAWKSMVYNDASSKIPIAIQLEATPKKNLMGAELTIKSGEAEGRKVLIGRAFDDFVILGGGDASLTKLRRGDELEISNRDFLASQTYHRHQVPPEGYPVYDQFRDGDGKPIYPQRRFVLAPLIASNPAGSIPDGDFSGKMIVLSNLHDTEAYPWQGDWYYQAAKTHLGDEVTNRLRLWYTDRATHGDSSKLAVPRHTVSYLGVLQQALRDVSVWVEKDVAPPDSTNYKIVDGQVVVPKNATNRKGIQPVIQLTANGSNRAEVRVGETVNLVASVRVPQDSGKVTEVTWDFEGDKANATDGDVTPSESITVEANRSYEIPGTYFVVVRATSQRSGDTDTPFARIRNLERVRIVVRQ